MHWTLGTDAHLPCNMPFRQCGGSVAVCATLHEGITKDILVSTI
jgi:hypothetical protein